MIRIRHYAYRTEQTYLGWLSQYGAFVQKRQLPWDAPDSARAFLGDKTFITQARRIRKVFGGGMRQAGYLAAAGIYALDHHISRLKEDHQRARHLGKLLEKLPFVTEVLPIQTNIVIFKLDEKMPAATFLKTLADSEVLAVPFGKQTIRFVTHLDFTDEMLMEVEKVFKKI